MEGGRSRPPIASFSAVQIWIKSSHLKPALHAITCFGMRWVDMRSALFHQVCSIRMDWETSYTSTKSDREDNRRQGYEGENLDS